MIAQFKTALKNFNDTLLPIAFADVEFSFPSDTQYPNLCVKHSKYGLMNLLEGRTVATLPEIELALHQGGTIEYIEAFVAKTGTDFVFRDHLKNLIDARNTAKSKGDELMQQLLKLYVNTLYGKLAQGINPKTGFDISNEGTKELGQSPITQPYFAAMITGTLRAGLSALLVAIDELNKDGHDYKIISATTDGMLYSPSSQSINNFRACLKLAYQDNIPEALESGENIFKTFQDTDPILYNKLQEFPVLRLLEHSRASWGYDEYIEIKHAANRLLNIKTRGQIGYYDV